MQGVSGQENKNTRDIFISVVMCNTFFFVGSLDTNNFYSDPAMFEIFVSIPTF